MAARGRTPPAASCSARTAGSTSCGSASRPDQLDTDDPATTRSELRVPLDDLSPAEYVAYASRAVEAALALLERGAAIERLP